MKKHPTVTIGIPAYNEEVSIEYLLKNVLAQKGNFEIEKIIVISDGSSDKTVELAKSATRRSHLTTIVDNRERKGKRAVLNEILGFCESDILITLDADIIIEDNFCFDKLIEPISKHEADMVAGRLIPLPPKTFMEKALYVSVCVKEEIMEAHRNGDNIYTCHGAAMAFSKKLYKHLKIPKVVAEDAFSYLWAKKENYKYEYSKDAEVYYKLPNNLKDHQSQSVRFFHGQDSLNEFFDTRLVEKSYRLPAPLILRKTAKYLLKNPIEMASYRLILSLMKAKSHINPKSSLTWKKAESSKIKF